MIARPIPADERGGVGYLGAEFLTWLWWRSCTQPSFVHPDGTEIFVHAEELLDFRGEEAAARRAVLRAGTPAVSGEARAALRSGKLLVAFRLLLARGEDEARFTLRADDLEVQGLKLSAPGEIDGDRPTPRERVDATLMRLERFYADLDLMLTAFLEVRTAPAWRDEIVGIRAWARTPVAAETCA